MVEEMKIAIKRLENLPSDIQVTYAQELNNRLNEIDDLRAKIQSSLSSGDPIAFDAEKIKAKGRRRLKA